MKNVADILVGLRQSFEPSKVCLIRLKAAARFPIFQLNGIADHDRQALVQHYGVGSGDRNSPAAEHA